MSAELRVAIVGLGTVGVSLFKMLESGRKINGIEVSVAAVSARDKTKDRGIDLSKVKWYENPLDIAKEKDIDLIIELVGGTEGIAYNLIKEAIKNNKRIVTANKALLAIKGSELFELQKNSSSKIYYEAAVGGAIPCVKTIRESLSELTILSVSGILNGTCNYILSEMLSSGRDFADVLKDAQDNGYAEEDSSLDVDGIDTAHKLAVLSAICFKKLPDYEGISVKGIRDIAISDLIEADKQGYKIKLLAKASKIDNKVKMSVEPCKIPKDNIIANVNGALNIVSVETVEAGVINLIGVGAGGDATASAIVADIASIIGGGNLPLFSIDN